MFLRKAAPVSCFYCLAVQNPSPRDARAFQCTECATWNRYSRLGEILSDEPAMHTAALNVSNFARRASPSRNSLPSSFPSSVFCRTCQTNQTLLLNLLANYLPEPEDPAYPTMLEQLPAYKESLHQRYPPVCRNCQSAVDEELKKKNYMARTSALGSRLKGSRRMDTDRTSKPELPRDVLIWRVRGLLWIVSQICAVSLLALGALDRIDALVFFPSPAATLAFTLISFSWSFFDPTWYTVRKATLAGQRIRVLGRSQYIKFQLFSWIARSTVCLARLTTTRRFVDIAQPRLWLAAALLVDLVCFVLSMHSLQIQRPTPVRLIDTSRHEKAQEHPPPPPVDADPEPLLSALSLAPQPVIPKLPAPVFGQTSIPQAPAVLAQTNDEDEMDWTPTGPGADEHGSGESWLQPQRFFAPEQPTGLEALLERTTLRETELVAARTSAVSSSPRLDRRWIFGTSVVVLLAFLWAASGREAPVPVRPSLRSERVARMQPTQYARHQAQGDRTLRVTRRAM